MKNRDLVLHILENYFGEKEVPGPRSNPVILDIQKWALPETQDDTKVAWCAIALSFFIDQCYGSFEPILLARDFLKVGNEVKHPQLGDLVVYWRGSKSSWKGHVGIFIREDDNQIWTLGGNQDDQLNIKAYSKRRVLGYRRV